MEGQYLLTPEDVFVTDGYPEHTYVAFEAGQKETELRDGLAQKNKIISISGPSKSGKTTLCDRIFGTDKGVSRIYVTGDAVSKPEDLWLRLFVRLLTAQINRSSSVHRLNESIA